MAKTLTFSKNEQFFDQIRGKWAKKLLVRILISHFHELTILVVQKTKHVHRTCTNRQKIVKTGEKCRFVTTSNVFLTKIGQSSQKTFPRLNTTNK